MRDKKLVVTAKIDSLLTQMLFILLRDSLEIVQDADAALRSLGRNRADYDLVLIDGKTLPRSEIIQFARSVREDISSVLPGIVVVQCGFDVQLIKAGVDACVDEDTIFDLALFGNDGSTKQLDLVINFMADLLKNKDLNLHRHSARVKTFTQILVAFCVEEGILQPSKAYHTTVASYFHDFGKLLIRESILNKPSKLSEEEFSVMKTHTSLGTKVLENLSKSFTQNNFLSVLFNVMKYHHERFDARGYPEGLRAEQIPLEARIVAIADVLEALTADRPYRNAYTFEEALNIIAEEDGHFDPKLLQLFMENAELFRD